MLKEENEYLNFLALGTKIVWNEEYIVYLPLDSGDQSIIIENQRVSKIAIKKLSTQYKEALSYVVEDILEKDISSRRSKKSI